MTTQITARNHPKPARESVTFIDWRMLPTMTDAVQVGGRIGCGIVRWYKRGYKPWCRPQLDRFRNACEFAV